MEYTNSEMDYNDLYELIKQQAIADLKEYLGIHEDENVNTMDHRDIFMEFWDARCINGVLKYYGEISKRQGRQSMRDVAVLQANLRRNIESEF
jgi:hypothetical protein